MIASHLISTATCGFYRLPRREIREYDASRTDVRRNVICIDNSLRSQEPINSKLCKLIELRKLEYALPCNTANISEIPFSVIPCRIGPRAQTLFVVSKSWQACFPREQNTRLSTVVNIFKFYLCETGDFLCIFKISMYSRTFAKSYNSVIE